MISDGGDRVPRGRAPENERGVIARSGLGRGWLLVALAGFGLAACGGSSTQARPTSPGTTSTAGTSASPTPQLPTSPLTGLPAVPGPVVAVKVDNVSTDPQTGLNDADVVYVELVEGGLTRLLAVFGSHQPTAVGPVRSARTSDIDLLGQYGRVALAFSGANSGVAASIRAANLQDDAYDYHPELYSFDKKRPSPYQFLLDVAKTAGTAAGVGLKDVGFRFGPPPATPTPLTPTTTASGPAPPTLTARYAGATVSATWDVASGSWLISRDGRPQMLTDGTRADATNILVQYVSISTSKYTDHNGVATPVSKTIGSGKAVLFRDGQRYDGTWARPSAAAATTWSVAGGAPLTLSPGRTWVLLLPVGSSLVAN